MTTTKDIQGLFCLTLPTFVYNTESGKLDEAAALPPEAAAAASATDEAISIAMAATVNGKFLSI